MKKLFNKLKNTFSLSGIIYILFGIVLLFFPAATRNIICYLFGGLILFYGLIHIISFFALKGTSHFFEGDLATGLVTFLIGGLIIARANVVLSVLPFILGVVIAVNGAFNISKALSLKALNYSKWWTVLIMSVLTVGLGILLVFNPLQAADFAISLVGISLIVTGVCDIWAATRADRILREEVPDVIIMDETDF